MPNSNPAMRHVAATSARLCEELLAVRDQFPSARFIEIEGEADADEFVARTEIITDAHGLVLCAGREADFFLPPAHPAQATTPSIPDLIEWLDYENFSVLVDDQRGLLPKSVLRNAGSTYSSGFYTYVFDLDALASWLRTS